MVKTRKKSLTDKQRERLNKFIESNGSTVIEGALAFSKKSGVGLSTIMKLKEPNKEVSDFIVDEVIKALQTK